MVCVKSTILSAGNACNKRVTLLVSSVRKKLFTYLCFVPGIRNKLLETEDHVCPSCDSMDVSPDGLIANQMLRRAVTNFQNETGYVKIAQRANAIKQAQAKAAEAAKAAAAATQILQKNVAIVPRGPSVLDYRPPPTAQAPSAPVPSLSSSQRSSPDQEQAYKPASIEQEPPTPTLDEPARLLNHMQHHPIISMVCMTKHYKTEMLKMFNTTGIYCCILCCKNSIKLKI